MWVYLYIVESVFVLNDDSGHSSYNAFSRAGGGDSHGDSGSGCSAGAERGRSLFSLAGPACAQQRRDIYRLLLSQVFASPHVCCRMLPYADVCYISTASSSHRCSHHLAYADVC